MEHLWSKRPLRALLLLLGLAASALALLAAALLPPAGAGAQAGMMMGLDMQPQDNTARSVSRVQTCTKVGVGDAFQADVWVDGVQNLVAWELRLDYDNSLLSLESADFNQFLVSTSPSGSVFPSLFDQEKPGRYFLAAAEFNGTPDSGSGVLARLSMKAVAKGLANVSIAANPGFIGPRLTAAGGRPIGDVNGDGTWDQPVINGQVAVDVDCGSSPPPITPGPGPGGGTPSTPGATQVPPAGAGGDAAGEPGQSAAASTQIVIEDGNGQVVLNAGQGDAPAGQPGENGTAAEPGSAGGQPGDAGQATGGVAEDNGPQQQAGGSSAFPAGILVAILAAAAAIGAGGAVSLMMLRRRRGL